MKKALLILLFLLAACAQQTTEPKVPIVENIDTPPVEKDLFRYCARFTLSECPSPHCIPRANCPNCETTCQPKTETEKQEEQRQLQRVRINCYEYSVKDCPAPPCIVSPICFNCDDLGCFTPAHADQLKQDKEDYEASPIAPLCEQQGGTWFYFSNGCADGCSKARAKEPVICTQNMNWQCECGPNRCWNGTGCEQN